MSDIGVRLVVCIGIGTAIGVLIPVLLYLWACYRKRGF
jgi:hypothetical protein